MFEIRELLKEYLFVSSMALLISLALTPFIRRYCLRHHVLDFPTDPRRIHRVPIPRLGGIAIYAAFFLPLFAMFFSAGDAFDLFVEHADVLLSLFAAGSLVFAIGVYDDMYGATVPQKFAAQTLAAVAMHSLGFKITLLSVPFIGSVPLGIWGFPLTILWIVGLTNALNFIDGIDGLACGVGFFSITTMFILSIFLHHPLTAFFAAALAGAILGFAMYNFAPASIFMGDSGSLFIGFIIAAISLQGSQKSSTAVVLLIPVVALGLPITDTVLAILRRVSKGLSPFSADKEHIHHKLLGMGFSSRQVVLILYAVCITLGVTALLMTTVSNQGLTLILIALSVMAISGMKILGFTTDVLAINAMMKKRIQEKKRFLERQQLASQMILEIESASDFAALKAIIVRYFKAMEVDVGQCVFPSRQYTQRHPDECRWISPRYERRDIPIDRIWTVGVPLGGNDGKYGELRIGKFLESTNSFAHFEMMAVIEQLKCAVDQRITLLMAGAAQE